MSGLAANPVKAGPAYSSFLDGMEAAAQICGSLAETTYDDADGFEAATGCEAAIMRVVREQRTVENSASDPWDIVRDAIAASDAAEKACPVNQGRVKGSEPCPLCGALANQTCFRTASADYRAMQMVRRATASAELDRQGHRDDCAIRLPHPASVCTCHIADKQRAETFANGLRDDDGLCSHCGAPLYPSERCDCWDRVSASCGTRPKGGDAHAAPALPSDAVSEAQTPNLSRPIPDTLNAGGCE